MTKKKISIGSDRTSEKEYPDAGCTLDYNDAWKLLVSVRLAAQCTDARVNYSRTGSICEVSYHRGACRGGSGGDRAYRPSLRTRKSKARDISACMKMLRDEYAGEVPRDFQALLKLPGVGRKARI